MKFAPTCAFSAVLVCMLAQSQSVEGLPKLRQRNNTKKKESRRKLNGYQTEYYPPYGGYPEPNPTERPTPRPTPNPTERPTPLPTQVPTYRPSPNPTPLPTPMPTPFPTFRPTFPPTRKPTEVPTHPPTRQPTPLPTRHPTPDPTRNPTSAPSPEPTQEPSPGPSPEPSPEPSEEPSENPTQSEEPSENPTQSEEPSDNPTFSEEPSENPTSEGEVDLSTIAEIICDPENQNIFEIFCDIIRGFGFDILLNGFEPLFDDASLSSPRAFGIPGKGGDGNNDARALLSSKSDTGRKNDEKKRSLQDYIINYDEFVEFFQQNLGELERDNKLLFTVFVPSNTAFENTNQDMDIITGGGDFDVLSDIVSFHIHVGEINASQLRCGRKYNMLNGIVSTTECRDSLQKFQVGAGNKENNYKCVLAGDGKDCQANYPRIIRPRNILASNGVIHTIDDLMVPLKLREYK